VRIALRPSGGRGEYELAGHQAGTHASALFDKELEFQISPELLLPGRQAAHHVQGKPRIRRDGSASLHAYRLLAGALVLPKPKRELRATTTDDNFVRDNQYAVTGIDVDLVDDAAASARLRPTMLWLQNASGLVRAVDVAERMALVQEIWDAARTQTSLLADLVRAHETAVLSRDHRSIEKASADVRAAIPIDGDVLAAIATTLGTEVQHPGVGPEMEEVPVGEEDETDPAEAARRAVAKWRKSVQRSTAARAFSERVRAAYRDRCAVSGARLPKLPSTLSPGVDGAHILPWARYELNTLKNGICLDKLCHWAFDAGVLRIDYKGGEYLVSVPNRVGTEAGPYNMDTSYFEQFVGAIPSERLPADSSQRPSPQYLAQLNAEMYG
jgi:hypothetical protein